MKNVIYFIGFIIIFFWQISCKDGGINVEAEKLIFNESDIKKCECGDKIQVCYYDTVKTFLFTIKDEIGILKQNYIDSSRLEHIIVDKYKSYITGPSKFGEPFYWWTIMSGYTSPCNFPKELAFNKKYFGRKVKFTCDVMVIPAPPPGRGYPSANGYPVILKKIEILPD